MSAYAVHVYNNDAASHEQQYHGPFRSWQAAESFADRVQARIEQGGNGDGTIGAQVIVLQKPLIRLVADEGWFDYDGDDD